MTVTPGTTSKSVFFFLRNETTAEPQTGLAYNSSGANAAYCREGGTAVAIVLATLAAADSVYSSGGFKEVSSGSQPGIYRLDVPNAALAAGAGSVVVTLNFDGTLAEALLIELKTAVNNVGAGAVEHVIRITDGSSNPLEGIACWITSDSAGAQVAAGTLTTNTSGEVTFFLDASTSYYAWFQGPGYTGTNPTSFTTAAS